MAKTNDIDVLEEALKKVPKNDYILQQERGGRTFDYLPGWYVIKMGNEVFGAMNWQHEAHYEAMKHIKMEDIKSKSTGKTMKHGVFYCPVSVTVTWGDYKKKTTEIGVTEYVGEANMEMGIKGCVTDGLKRAFHVLGNQFGLSLYDPDNIDGREESPKRESKKSTSDESSGPTMEEGQVPPTCEKCGNEMRLRSGRYGDFWSCTGYPECKTIYDVSQVDVEGNVYPKGEKHGESEPVSGPSVDEVKGKKAKKSPYDAANEEEEKDEADIDDLPF